MLANIWNAIVAVAALLGLLLAGMKAHAELMVRLSRMDDKLGSIIERMDGTNERINNVNRRLDDLATRVAHLEGEQEKKG